MNLSHNPDLLDRLACSYALGSLRGGARRRLEAMARERPTIRAAVLLWQERMAALTELQAPQSPSPNVWKRIENLVALEAQQLPRRSVDVAPTAMPMAASGAAVVGALQRALGWWRVAAIAGVAVSVGALLVANRLSNQVTDQSQWAAAQQSQLGQMAKTNAALLQQVKTAPKVEYVAVLADDKSAASVLVTFDVANQRLVIKRVGSYDEGPAKSLQLWALPAAGAPRSLGVMGSEPVVRLSTAKDQVREVPTLAISLEPKGGVPSAGGPTGPVLFKGALIQTVL
jgi:anti-sigma-K factor RskA